MTSWVRPWEGERGFRGKPPRPFLSAALAAAIPGYRDAVQAQLREEQAKLNLLTITEPHRHADVLAEVERRWEMHCDLARSGVRSNLGKSAVYDSVRHDVSIGLL